MPGSSCVTLPMEWTVDELSDKHTRRRSAGRRRRSQPSGSCPTCRSCSSFCAIAVCCGTALAYASRAGCRLRCSATLLRQMNRPSTVRANTPQTTINGTKLKFINDLRTGLQPDLRAAARTPESRRTQVLPVETLPGRLFDRFHHQQQIRIQRALHLLPGLACAIRACSGRRNRHRAGWHQYTLNVVAVDRLDCLGHLREELK